MPKRPEHITSDADKLYKNINQGNKILNDIKVLGKIREDKTELSNMSGNLF